MNNHCLQTMVTLMAVALLLTVPCSVASGQADQSLIGEASGMITIRDLKGNKDVELKHVYAVKREVTGPDDFLIDLLFTDRPVSTGILERRRYVKIMAAEKRLNSLAVILDKDQKLLSAYLYYDGFSCIYDSRDADGPSEYSALTGRQLFSGQVNEAQQLIRGTVSSAKPTRICTGNEEITWQYRVSFTAKLELRPAAPKPSNRASEIAKAYNAFHKAVEAEDFEAVKQMLAADVVNTFAGAEARTRGTLLKRLLGPYRFLYNVQLYESGKVADFEIFKTPVRRNNLLMPLAEPFYWYSPLDAPARTRPSPPPATRTASPPPPPPPPAPAPIVRLQLPEFTIRMIFEDGQWKVYWLASTDGFPGFDGNVLLHLDTYKKP